MAHVEDTPFAMMFFFCVHWFLIHRLDERNRVYGMPTIALLHKKIERIHICPADNNDPVINRMLPTMWANLIRLGKITQKFLVPNRNHKFRN